MTTKNKIKNAPNNEASREGSPGTRTNSAFDLVAVLTLGGGLLLANFTSSYDSRTESAGPNVSSSSRTESAVPNVFSSSNARGYSGVRSPHCYLKFYSKDNCRNGCHSVPAQSSNNSRDRHYERRHRNR